MQHGVSAAVGACDTKMFSVAYFGCFIAKCLLNSNCDICKKCLISDLPSTLDVYTGFKEHSSTVQSLTYPTEKLVETVGTAMTVFCKCDIKGGLLKVSLIVCDRWYKERR